MKKAGFIPPPVEVGEFSGKKVRRLSLRQSFFFSPTLIDKFIIFDSFRHIYYKLDEWREKFET